jgi:predicted anti-sigma-YlaC factor YlaD
MPCQELVEVVTDYLEGALDPIDRRRFQTHLDECGDCRTYVDQMRRTIAVLGRVDAETLSDDLRDGLLEAFRGWRAG